jgi:membrane protein implicated in regulation of membrane protease activity
VITVTWETFYLVCFVVGFSLSALSFLLGVFHLPHLHFPHHGGGLHLGGGHMGGGHVGGGHAGGAHVGGAHGGAPQAGSAASYSISPLNYPTLLMFLVWFGGTGYLLTHYGHGWGFLGLLVSVVVGVAGAAIVFWFLAKVLVKPDENLDPADYVMVGTLGRLTVGIREKGTGEIVYVQGGTRKSSAARSEDARPIEKGTEVVITQFDKGIAYVRRWDELSGEPQAEESRGTGQN